MDIAVVILNWNGKKLLEQFLPSVISHSEGAKIYVADNASTDESLDYITTEHPEVIILKNRTNMGFAGGYNEALTYVEESIYVLLNNDVEVTHGWLKPMLTKFEESAEIAAIQPKLKSVQHPESFDYAGAAGGYIDALGYPFCRGRIFDTLEEDHGQYDTQAEIFWASGACLAIRKACFREVGGFDQSFFAHMEEIDLCWRLKNIGYTIWCVPESTVYHLGGGTLSSSNPQKTYLNFRNSLCTILKNSKANPAAKILIRMVLDGVAAIRYLLLGKASHFVSIFKAHLGFYKLLPEMLKKRKHLIKKEQKFVVNSIVWHSFVLNVFWFKELKTGNK